MASPVHFLHTEADTSNSGFASEASRTWNTFLRSMGGVVSGEGLVSSGLTPEAARQEVTKIDQENAKWLSQFSEQEILEQQEKIKNALGTGGGGGGILCTGLLSKV